jgi:hypothetical protein
MQEFLCLKDGRGSLRNCGHQLARFGYAVARAEDRLLLNGPNLGRVTPAFTLA